MQQSAARLVACLCLALLAPSAAHAAQGASGSGSGSGAMPSCVAKLVPCAGYLNATSTATTAPAADCCDPLRDAAANETACMCAMLLNRAALRAFGVAPEQGLLLARRCNVTTHASACAASTTAGTTTTTTAASSSASTGSGSASFSSSSSSVPKPTANGGSVARRLSLTGASSLVGFSFIWWMIMP